MEILVKQNGDITYMVYVKIDETNIDASQARNWGEVGGIVKHFREKYNIDENKFSIDNTYGAKKNLSKVDDSPLILVFYIDRNSMGNTDFVTLFADSVNQYIEMKEANIMAFFLPTDEKERIECINPKQLEKLDMERVNKLVQDISDKFDMNDNNINENE